MMKQRIGKLNPNNDPRKTINDFVQAVTGDPLPSQHHALALAIVYDPDSPEAAVHTVQSSTLKAGDLHEPRARLIRSMVLLDYALRGFTNTLVEAITLTQTEVSHNPALMEKGTNLLVRIARLGALVRDVSQPYLDFLAKEVNGDSGVQA